MDTRYLSLAHSRARGAVRPMHLGVVLVLALLVAAAWWLVIRPREQMLSADRGPPAPGAMSTAASAVPPPANVDSLDLNELLAQARAAINQQRYLSPAGNNAVEFYLRALEKQPGDPVATEALREIFPFATNSVDQAINKRDFIEAQRQIDLLAKADPTNFTLTILRSKLDAQRKLLDREQEKQLSEQQAHLTKQKSAAARLAADRLAAGRAQQVEPPSRQEAPPRSAALPAQKAPETARAEAAPRAATVAAPTQAVKISTVNPRYPTQAARAKQEGYVIVAFIVTPEGTTTNVRVTDSRPIHVFDRAAIDAVERWRFKPATRNGEPVASEVTNRIDFKLGTLGG